MGEKVLKKYLEVMKVKNTENEELTKNVKNSKEKQI